MRIVGHLTPDEFWRRVESSEEQVRAGASSIPIYGLSGWGGPIMIGDWEWEDMDLILAGLAHGTPDADSCVGVVTTVHDPRRQTVRSMERAIGLTRIDVDYERRHRAIEDATGIGSRSVSTVVRPPSRSGEDVNAGGPLAPSTASESFSKPVDIRWSRLNSLRVDDVEPYLAGWREYIRLCRGE